MNLYAAELLTLLSQVIDSLFYCLRAAAHDYDDLLGIGSAYVIEQLVLSAEFLSEFIHDFLYDFGSRCVIFVSCFSVLEVYVAVLSSTLLMRMLRVESALAELAYSVPIYHGSEVVILKHIYLADLVRCAETVEEVYERNLSLERGEVRYGSHIHNFLYGVAAEQGEACLTSCHYVSLIAEDVESVSCDSSCCYMEHAGSQLAGDFIHVRDHEEKTLRRRERSGESACCERAVDCACCACLGLHLLNLHNLTEDIFSALRSPFVAGFCHG